MPYPVRGKRGLNKQDWIPHFNGCAPPLAVLHIFCCEITNGTAAKQTERVRGSFLFCPFSCLLLLAGTYWHAPSLSSDKVFRFVSLVVLLFHTVTFVAECICTAQLRSYCLHKGSAYHTDTAQPSWRPEQTSQRKYTVFLIDSSSWK